MDGELSRRGLGCRVLGLCIELRRIVPGRWGLCIGVGGQPVSLWDLTSLLGSPPWSVVLLLETPYIVVITKLGRR